MAPKAADVVPPWGMALAGSAGAVFANTLVYPLDIVKTRIQVQASKKAEGDDHHYEGTVHALQTIIEKEGIAGLYSGLAGSLLGVASTNFAYFYWYTIVRTAYQKASKNSGPAGTATELALGAVAGALAQLFTIPIAVVTTRQQTQKPSERKSMMETARDIMAEKGGIKNLWRGLNASLVLVVNPSITYGAYQRLKDSFFAGRNNLATWEAFILGAASKALATLATQPLIVAKVRLQSNPPPERKGKRFESFGEVLQHTVEHEGVLKLFKGIIPQLTKGVLVQGIMMMTKERVELLFVLLFAYVKNLRQRQLAKAAELVANKSVLK